MPKYLYLLRHAQSAEKQHGQTDLQRELTADGIKQALQIGNYLREQKTFPDSIFCSTAERAKATAHIVADAIGFDRDHVSFQEDLYEASTRILFQFVTQLDDKLQQVLCVAHNPAVSYVAEYLTEAEIGEIVPAGMAIIQFNTGSWSEITAGSGEFIRYIAF